MKYGLYSVRDCLNGFGVPVCDFNDGTAKRNFQSSVAGHQISNPGDYDLFRIGHFDVDTGIVSPEASPVLIMRGIDVRKEDHNE